MKALVRQLKVEDKEALFLVIHTTLQAGDWGVSEDGELVQVNQSTCIFHAQKVLGVANTAFNLKEGDFVDVRFRCDKLDKCAYPFCTGSCNGATNYYLPDFEPRGY